MFQKSIEAIIAQGVKNLEGLKKSCELAAAEAAQEVRKRQSEIQALVNLGRQVPEKVFDRYSNVQVCTININDGTYPGSNYITLGSTQAHLAGLMGDESMKPGKYRVIVLLEPIQ